MASFHSRLLFLALTAVPFPAVAATPAGTAMDQLTQLEEVTVSARRVDEPLDDVAVMATVLAGDRLEEMAFTRLDELTVPGVRVGASGLTDTLSIRGIASGNDFGFEQSAPTFLDGLWQGSSRASRLGLLDVERVEVLKGPQSTYYGKNTTAGAIGIVTRKPQRDFGAQLEAYREFAHEETTLSGMVNVPLGATLAVRAAVRWRLMDVFLDNLVAENTPGHRDRMGRIALRWTPTTALTMDWKAEYSGNLSTGREIQYVRCVPQLFQNPRLVNAQFEDCRMDGARAQRYDPAAFGAALALFTDPGRPGERFDSELFATRLAADWRGAAGYTLSALVGYTAQDFFAWAKPDHSWNQRMLAAFDDSSRTVSQELRLDSPATRRWFWMAGAYHEDVARDNSPFTQMSLQNARAILTNWREDSAAWAAFGELGIHVTPTVTVRAGGRYTTARRRIDANRSVYALLPSGPGTDPSSFAVPATVTALSAITTQQGRRDAKFTPALGLEWRPRDRQMYYLSWREGFKAGGFSSFLGGPVDQLGFEPETVTYLEAGMKLQGAEERWRASIAAFDGQYRALQLAIIGEDGVAVTRNAGSAHSRGVEMEFAWAIARGWQVATGASYLDARYDDFRNASCYPTPMQTIAQGCVRIGGAALPPDATVCRGAGVACAQDLSGFPTSFAPEWSGTLSLRYRHEFPSRSFGEPLVLSASTELFATERYYTTVNGAAGSVQGGFAKLDARVALGAPGGRWELALVGRNLTNRHYANWYEPLVGAGPDTGWFATTARPRQLALQARLSF